MANDAPITLEQLFRFWRNLPHQRASIPELEADLRLNGYEAAMRRYRPWFATWSQAGKQQESTSKPTPEAGPSALVDAVRPLLRLIYAGEGGYDSYNRGKAGDSPGSYPGGGLKLLTLAQVQQLQAEGKVFAVGAAQFIPETLKMAAQAAGLGPAELFNGQNQDRLAAALLLGGKRPALAAYLKGTSHDIEAAQLDLAKEWASIPGPDGRGFYDGDSAGNRASAKPAEVRAALQAARAAISGKPDGSTMSRPADVGVPAKKASNPLIGVPKYKQTDSARVEQRERTCFSSTAAMALEFLKPGTLKGPNGDDQYLGRVMVHGDTTSAKAQVAALASYGVQARLVTNADFRLVEQQIDRGRPVGIGFIHRGPVTNPAPSCDGHWILAIGYTPSSLIVHDPYWEADLVSGETVKRDAFGVKYGRQNLGRRWMVQKVGGLWRYAPGKGWALVFDS
jgi:hypothetical protein